MLEQGVDLIIQRFHWLAEFRLFIHYQRVWIIRNFFSYVHYQECVHFPCFAGYVQTWCARPAFSVFFFFFWKFCFLQPQHCVLCPQYVPTGYVHSETDGLMLLELLLKGSGIARPLCTTLMDNIGSTTQMWGWGAMGNTHPRAWIYRL